MDVLYVISEEMLQEVWCVGIGSVGRSDVESFVRGGSKLCNCDEKMYWQSWHAGDAPAWKGTRTRGEVGQVSNVSSLAAAIRCLAHTIDEESNTYIIDFQLGLWGAEEILDLGGQLWLPWLRGSFNCIVFAVELEEGGIGSFSMPFKADFVVCQVINVIHPPAVQHLGYLQQNLGERDAVSARQGQDVVAIGSEMLAYPAPE